MLIPSAACAQAQFVQQGPKLVGSGAIGNPAQGDRVALSADGTTALVAGIGDNGNEGATWVFVRTGGSWVQQAKLLAAGASAFAEQGADLALSADGDTALIGSPTESKTGAAWVFSRSGGVWSQQAKIVPAGATNGGFGDSVALSGDGTTALIGNPVDNHGTGAVWVFTRSGADWTQQGELIGSDAVGGALQGRSIALSADGNTALVGGPQDNGLTGAAWVFTRTGTTWSQQGSKLSGLEATVNAAQGSVVALSGDGNTALLGAPGDSGNKGGAWAFVRTGSTWRQQGRKLAGTGASVSGQQGWGVALSGDGSTALIGDPGQNPAGGTWVFTRSAGAWTQQPDPLVGSGASGGTGQGTSVALSQDGKTALIGGPGDNNVGAAWVFGLADPPTAAITSPAPGASFAFDQFVTARFACTEGSGGTGLRSCLDDHRRPSGAALDTATPGTHDLTVTATSSDGLTGSATLSYSVALPSNRFSIRRIDRARSGRVGVRIKLPWPGIVNVLATAPRANLAAAARSRAPSTFAFGRGRFVLRRGGTFHLVISPTRQGVRLLRHHRHAVLIRLAITYTPAHGRARTISLRGLRMPRLKAAANGRLQG